ESIGNEVVIGVTDSEVVDLASEVLDRLNRGDAFPHHAGPRQPIGRGGTELLKGGEFFSNARCVLTARVEGPLDEAFVDSREESLHDFAARHAGGGQRGDFPGGLLSLDESALLVLEVLNRECGESCPLPVVLVADLVPQVEQIIEKAGEDKAQAYRRAS